MVKNKNVSSRIPSFGDKNDYKKSFVTKRRDWLSDKTGTKFKHIATYSQDTEKTRGNIENLIGASSMPLGITGPLKVNGKYAKGMFYVPMATTEGALITDYNVGMKVISRTDGVNVRILKNVIHISPVFKVKDCNDADLFIDWVKSKEKQIKKEAQKTTRHGELIACEPHVVGRRVILNFQYDTKDAQGMNMINKATEVVCEYISKNTKKEYYLRSRYTGVKMVTMRNIHKGYGREVFADCIIPRKVLSFLNVTPEQLCDYYNSSILTSVHSGIVGMTAHIANGMTAIYIACGQDVADISTSHIGISMCEMTEDKDLYISLYIPNLLIGTIGGGTGLGSQKECLEIMNCYGSNKANKFAEIVTAACLVGELAVSAAIVNRTFVVTHETLGRNRPQKD